MPVRWYGNELTAAVQKAIAANIFRAGEHLRRAMRDEINKPAPRIVRLRTRDTVRGKKGSRYVIRVGSIPPLPPHKRIGFLQVNTIHEHDASELESRIGVTKAAIYGLYLETGWRTRGGRHVRARPWMRLSLEKHRGELARICGTFHNLRGP